MGAQTVDRWVLRPTSTFFCLGACTVCVLQLVVLFLSFLRTPTVGKGNRNVGRRTSHDVCCCCGAQLTSTLFVVSSVFAVTSVMAKGRCVWLPTATGDGLRVEIGVWLLVFWLRIETAEGGLCPSCDEFCSAVRAAPVAFLFELNPCGDVCSDD